MSDLKTMSKLIGKKETIGSLMGMFIGACLATSPMKLFALAGASLVLAAGLFMIFGILKELRAKGSKKSFLVEYNNAYIISSVMVYQIVGLEIIAYTIIKNFAQLSFVETEILATSFVLLTIFSAVVSGLIKEIITNRLKMERIEKHNC